MPNNGGRKELRLELGRGRYLRDANFRADLSAKPKWRKKTAGAPYISPEGSQALARDRQYDSEDSYRGFENESLNVALNRGPYGFYAPNCQSIAYKFGGGAQIAGPVHKNTGRKKKTINRK